VIKFAEPAEGTITKICADCMRTDVEVQWNEELWGYFCVDFGACLSYQRRQQEWQTFCRAFGIEAND